MMDGGMMVMMIMMMKASLLPNSEKNQMISYLYQVRQSTSYLCCRPTLQGEHSLTTEKKF